jgi:murein DD-endopeptidase MepM/ murein hydrolase activator NlpD
MRMAERGAFRALVAGLWFAATPGLCAAHSVTVDPPAVPVGGLALIHTDAPVATGTFDGSPLRFFAAQGGSSALVGVDLDRRSGRYPIEVRCCEGMQLRAQLEVREKAFPEERLTVPKPYVEPDAAALRRIGREQRLLAALWGRSAPVRFWRGWFAPPCDGAAGSPFGLRRFFNGEPRSPHAGIDFRAPEGAPVHASNRGRVVLAQDLFFTGHTVVIDHGLGLFTLYVHLSQVEVRRGAMVDKGQEIGQVGMTGRATGPHLHFAARVVDARIDPEALLERNLD